MGIICNHKNENKVKGVTLEYSFNVYTTACNVESVVTQGSPKKYFLYWDNEKSILETDEEYVFYIDSLDKFLITGKTEYPKVDTGELRVKVMCYKKVDYSPIYGSKKILGYDCIGKKVTISDDVYCEIWYNEEFKSKNGIANKPLILIYADCSPIQIQGVPLLIDYITPCEKNVFGERHVELLLTSNNPTHKLDSIF